MDADNCLFPRFRSWNFLLVYSLIGIATAVAFLGKAIIYVPGAKRAMQTLHQTMLDSVDVVVQSDGMVDDPLDDEGSLKEAMDRFPVIARVSYVLLYYCSSFLPSFLFLFVMSLSLSCPYIAACLHFLTRHDV